MGIAKRKATGYRKEGAIRCRSFLRCPRGTSAGKKADSNTGPRSDDMTTTTIDNQKSEGFFRNYYGFCVEDEVGYWYDGTTVEELSEASWVTTSCCGVTITWSGCSPTSSTSPIGCGSNYHWWWGGVRYCGQQRYQIYPDGTYTIHVYALGQC